MESIPLEEPDIIDADENGGPSDAVTLEPEPEKAPTPSRKRRGIPLSFLLNGLTLGLGSWALVTQWDKHVIKPTAQFIGGLVIGAWSGFSWVRKYKKAKKRRNRMRRILNFEYGTRELNVLMKEVPYWLDFGGVERMQYFNRLIGELWRFYDAAICKQIVAMVEPLLMANKPMFVKSIRFDKLTFGSAPFKTTHISVLKSEKDEVVLELGTRWDGSACVAIAIEIQGAGRISPAVKRLNFFANVRLGLTRMVNRMPGFGAMLISLQAPPLVTFDIDCGGGIGELIEAWLIPFLKNDILGNSLVWPNRIVIPLLPPEVTGPLDNLKLRTKGVLKVNVIEAKHLPKADIMGKGDPFVLLETVAFKPSRTKTIKNTQNPKWEETHFLKVQEVDQSLKVMVRDQESSVMGALTLQTSELQGQALIPIEDLPMGGTVDNWYDLGKEDWGAIGGPGDGCGQIHLQLTYYTLDSLRDGQFVHNATSTIPRGLVFVTIGSGNNLYSPDGNAPPDPYCVLWLCDIQKSTKTLKQTRDPIWNESVDWSNVDVTETLFVEVYDKGTVSDRVLGKATLPILTIAKEFVQGKSHKSIECTLELESGRGDVVLTIEWVPLDKNPLPVDQLLQRSHSILDASPRGVLFVNLVSGEDLKNVDKFDLSDPYCILKIGGSPKVSKYIKNNLNPVWKQSFSWTGVREMAILHIEVFDKGALRDKTLGVCELPIAPALQPIGSVHPFTVPLRSKKTGEVSKGVVNLQLCWKPWRRDTDEPRPEEPKWIDFDDFVVDS
eukprot:g3847.t1